MTAAGEAAGFLGLAASVLDATARGDRPGALQRTTEATDVLAGLRARGILDGPLDRALLVVLGYTADAACEVPS